MCDIRTVQLLAGPSCGLARWGRGAALLSLSLETRTLKGYMGGLGLVTMLGHLQDKQDVKTIWGRRMRQQQEKSTGVRPCDLQEWRQGQVTGFWRLGCPASAEMKPSVHSLSPFCWQTPSLPVLAQACFHLFHPKVLIKTNPLKNCQKRKTPQYKKRTKDMNKEFTKEYNQPINIWTNIHPHL